MNFLKKHWLSLIILLIVLYLLWQVAQLINTGRQAASAAANAFNPMYWINLISTGVSNLWSSIFGGGSGGSGDSAQTQPIDGMAQDSADNAQNVGPYQMPDNNAATNQP